MCTGISIRCASCGHVGYQFSAICNVIGCLKAQGFVQLLPNPGFCPNCTLTQNLSGFYFEHPEVATLRAQAASFLDLFHEAEIKENEKKEEIQRLEKTIEQLSERDAGHEAGSVEDEGSETEQQENSTGGDQGQEVPKISELHSPRALAAAFETLRNDLDQRGDFWVEHIGAIEKELKMTFGTVNWAEVILTKEELDKLNYFRQSENLGTSKLE
jgi:hypothetical protein